MKYKISNLNPAIKRSIRRKEKYLNRKCRMIWDFENRLGERFLFGSFCRNWNRLTVTIAVYNPVVCGGWLTVNSKMKGKT